MPFTEREKSLRITHLEHDYPFDPTYGKHLGDLLQEGAPLEVPADFDAFWSHRRALALAVKPEITMTEVEPHAPGRRTFSIRFATWNHPPLSGWLDIPAEGSVERGLVMLHGYGGRPEGPDTGVFLENCAVLSPGLRGLPPSFSDDAPADAWQHVVAGIENLDTYVPARCVSDVWCALSALEAAVPETVGEQYLVGGSFGGGIGLVALAFETRFCMAHFGVPTFGNQPLRLTLPSVGSGDPVRQCWLKKPQVAEVVRYLDSAIAAQRVKVPVFVSPVLFDPAVAPPGQFASANALGGPRHVYVKQAGHFEHSETSLDNEAEFQAVCDWFAAGPEAAKDCFELAPSLIKLLESSSDTPSKK